MTSSSVDSLNAFRHWGRHQAEKFKAAVAFLESEDHLGDKGIGTCFHVGDGIFVTARHVIEGRSNISIGFDTAYPPHEATTIIDGPHFHPNPGVDVACFRANYCPRTYITLGGHLDDFMAHHDFLLYRVLIMGFPPIPLARAPFLVATVGEVNAVVDLCIGRHPRFIVSSMARGGFSGGPAIIAYDELNEDAGSAALGLVTESLVANSSTVENGYLSVLTVEPIFVCLENAGYSLPDQTSFMSLNMEREPEEGES